MNDDAELQIEHEVRVLEEEKKEESDPEPKTTP